MQGKFSRGEKVRPLVTVVIPRHDRLVRSAGEPGLVNPFLGGRFRDGLWGKILPRDNF